MYVVMPYLCNLCDYFEETILSVSLFWCFFPATVFSSSTTTPKQLHSQRADATHSVVAPKYGPSDKTCNGDIFGPQFTTGGAWGNEQGMCVSLLSCNVCITEA